jgi:hypothetical protein
MVTTLWPMLGSCALFSPPWAFFFFWNQILATSKGLRSLKDLVLTAFWEVKDQLRMGLAYNTYFTTIAYNFTTIAYNYFTTIPISRGVGRGLHVTPFQIVEVCYAALLMIEAVMFACQYYLTW